MHPGAREGARYSPGVTPYPSQPFTPLPSHAHSYATREGATTIKIFRNFTEARKFRPSVAAEHIFGGPPHTPHGAASRKAAIFPSFPRVSLHSFGIPSCGLGAACPGDTAGRRREKTEGQVGVGRREK